MRYSAALVPLLLAVACSPTAPATPGGNTNTGPKVEQTLIWGASSLQPALDPNVSLVGGARRYDLFETLVVQDPSGKNTQPQLAKDWKLVNETTWEFNLAEGRTFQDGSVFTSADVVFSYQRSMDPANRFTIVSRVSTYESVEASGPNKVLFKTKIPDPIFPKRTASVAIFPKATFEKMGQDAFFKAPVGSGPFKFVEFVPDDHLTLEVWKEHQTRKPKLEKVIVRHVPESAQRLNGLRTGAVDYAQGVPVDAYEQLKNDGFGLEVRTAGYSGSWGLDAIKESPLQEKKVRHAINYAINKQDVSKLVYNGLAPVELSQVTQPEAFGFDPSLKPWPFDPAKAKQLLAEAGYPNGFEVTADVWMASSELQRLALLIQQQLKDVGITVTINGYPDVATFLDKGRGVLPRAPMYNGAPAIIPQMDAGQALTTYLSAPPTGLPRMNSSAFDAVFAASAKEMDPAKREKLLQEAARILADEAPVLFLVQQTTVSGWSKNVKGIIPRIPDDLLLDTVEKIG